MGGPCTKCAVMSSNTDVSTLKLKLTVCALTSWSLNPVKLKVLEYRTKITKRVTLQRLPLLTISWQYCFAINNVQPKKKQWIKNINKMITQCLNIVWQGMQSCIFTDYVICYRSCRKANHRGRGVTRSIREGSIFSRSHIPLPSWMTIMHRLGVLSLALSHATQMCLVTL